MKVLCLHQDKEMWGNSAYRYVIPYDEMQRIGHIAEYCNIKDFEDMNGNPLIYDVLSVQRLFFKGSQEYSIKVVHDVDDDVLNPGKKLLSREEKKQYLTTISEVSAITVSTQHLKKAVERHTDRPVFVCPNAINVKMMDAIESPKNKQPTLALCGGPTHYDDWKVAQRILPDIMNENPDWILYLIGFVPKYLEKLITQFPNRVATFNFFLPYPKYLRLLKLVDVRLSPLDVKNPFNNSKSAIAAMEMMGFGKISIAQSINVYKELITDKETGFLCNSENDWYNTTQKVLKDGLLRRKIGKQAREYVEKNHDIQVVVHSWIKSYEDIMRL